MMSTEADKSRIKEPRGVARVLAVVRRLFRGRARKKVGTLNALS